MDCILFRHGIAVERGEWDGQEQDRPLTDKGVKRTGQSGRGLRTLSIVPTHLLTSPLLRARQTADILHGLLRPRPAVHICDELSPGTAPEKLFSLLNTLPPDSVVICIGHEPYLSMAAAIFLTGKPCAGLALKKAGACLIRLEEAAGPVKGLLEWWLTATQLRALA
ncbi:MAG: hypothetical protein OJF47_000689 [Nitrospira sp.]|nr:MAG: hypothetical protein OJF47_000689 [Nitrospira sp.]